jgi:hypothetical protein
VPLLQTTGQHRNEVARGIGCRVILFGWAMQALSRSDRWTHVSTATLARRVGSDNGKIQLAARPGIAILATQSGVPIHSERSQGWLAAVFRAAGCGDMPGRWRRDGAWRTPADRAGADAGEGELLPGLRLELA